MKTILTTLFFLTVAALSASIDPSDLFINANADDRLLTITSDVRLPQSGNLRVIDANGIVLHTAKLTAGNFIKSRLQLAALPSGEYRVEFTDSEGTTVQPLQLDAKGITVDVSLASRSFYPRVDLKEKMLTINYLNVAGERVDVRLSDQSGNEVITDRLPASTTVQRAYSLENLPQGSYYVTISSPGIRSHTTSLWLD